jgi:hypothetical protein
MKFLKLFLISILLLLSMPWAAAAQWDTPVPVKWVASLPANCSPTTKNAVLVYKYVSPRGLYACVAPDTWTQISSSGPTWGGILGTLSAQTDLQAALDSKVSVNTGFQPYVLSFDGNAQSVLFGYGFYPTNKVLGDCFYETYAKRLGGQYDWSDGYGATHAMLRSSVNGNFLVGVAVTAATNASPIVITTAEDHPYQTGASLTIYGITGNTAANGTFTVTRLSATTFSLNGSTGNGAYLSGGIVYGPVATGGRVDFGADDIPYVGQWHHSATSVDMLPKLVIQYYDGVPVGAVSFIGNRVTDAVLGGGNIGFMGGSDHSNFIGSIAQYRIFEGSNPITGSNINNPSHGLSSFRPDPIFGGRSGSLIVDFFQGLGVIQDKGAGFPTGTTHAGMPVNLQYGLGGGLQPAYPGPQFVLDPTLPDFFGTSAPIQPAGRTYSPVAPPLGALVFDSIERKNSTYTFAGLGGIGSTESGSLGPLPWIERPVGLTGNKKSFGILNEQFVFLADGVAPFARVAIPQTNLDIRVSRKTGTSYGAGISTGLMFRYVDDNNFCYASTNGATSSTQFVYVGQMVAGVATNWAYAAAPASWTTLRVTTKSDGSYAVYGDATLITSGTNATHASGTGAGIVVMPDPGHDFVGYQNAGLRLRWRNFTVFNNP